MSGEDPQRRALLKGLVGLGAVGLGAVGLARLTGGHATAPPSTATSRPAITSTEAAPPPTPTTPSTVVPPPVTTTSAATPEPIALEVISRTGWRARPAGEFVAHHPTRLTYHHSAAAVSDPDGAPDRIREYQVYHQQQGWPDVAYHFLVDQAGRVYQGRPPDAVGDTFTEYDPTGHFLACLDGDFDEAIPSPESIRALVSILAWAAVTFGIDPDSLGGHRDYATTTCPGAHAFAMRDEIASRVTELIETGRPVQLRLVEPGV